MQKLAVQFRLAGRDDFITRYSANISKGGIFIITREPPAVGEDIQFLLKDITGDTLFEGTGVVRWVRTDDSDPTVRPPGVGIQFRELSPESVGVLEQVLARRAPPPTAQATAVPPATRPTAPPKDLRLPWAGGGVLLGFLLGWLARALLG